MSKVILLSETCQLARPDSNYKNLIESLPVMFYAVEPTTPFSPIYISPAFENLGYPISDWLEKEQFWVKILHPDDREWVLAEIEEAMRNDRATDCIYRLITGDGTIRWIHDQGRFVEDGHGQLICWQGVMTDVTGHKQAEKLLRDSEERFRNLFENANDLIYLHDLEGNYLSINKAGERVLGYTKTESLAMNFEQIVIPEHCDRARKQLAEKLAGNDASTYEIDCRAKDGRRVSLEINSRLVFQDGEPVGVQGIARDITDRKLSEKALKESEKRFRDLFENANDLIYTHDLLGNFTSLNQTGELVTGYSRQEALGMNIAQVVAPEYLEYARKMTQRKISGDPPLPYELDIITKTGERVTLELNTRLIRQNKEPVGVQGIARNITERKLTEEQLQFKALYDPLTNLPNRIHFMKHLSLAVERAEKEDRFHFAVLFLDLDRFKVINDSLGHAVGDKLLVEIAERLSLCVRPSDVIARLGGDEFTILLSIKEDHDAIQVAERIQKVLTMPFKLNNYEVFTSASVGIIISGDLRRTPEDLLRDADAAMYQAKETGKARYEIFDHEMHVRNMNLLKIETDLRQAIKRDEFEVYYQPIVELETGAIQEFEALIRWNHPDKGLIMPDAFITVAEETGLIIPIGEWILRESCRQTKEWQDLLPEGKSISISVNLSAKQLMHPSLTGQVKQVLSETGLSPEFLKLEVTESMVMEHSETALRVLTDFREQRVHLSTDDFGTGYSSLSYLHQFPFQRLKIDRSFVMKMDTDMKSEAIVRTILMLGQNLEIEVTAEGIENEQQLWQLRSLGCRRGQGYLFSKPVTSEAAAKLIQNGLPLSIETLEAPFIFADVNSDKPIKCEVGY